MEEKEKIIEVPEITINYTIEEKDIVSKNINSKGSDS